MVRQLSHLSPTPSPSASAWSMLYMWGQLSTVSHFVSPSVSTQASSSRPAARQRRQRRQRRHHPCGCSTRSAATQQGIRSAFTLPATPRVTDRHVCRTHDRSPRKPGGSCTQHSRRVSADAREPSSSRAAARGNSTDLAIFCCQGRYVGAGKRTRSLQII
jgi:hypothetical protein